MRHFLFLDAFKTGNLKAGDIALLQIMSARYI